MVRFQVEGTLLRTMTLSDIEITLEELSARHQNLDAGLLAVLLSSAGWDESSSKDALTLFKQKGGREAFLKEGQNSTPPLNATQTEPSKDEITFYQSDGSAEKPLPTIPEAPPIVREQAKEGILSKIEESLPVIPLPVVSADPVLEQENKKQQEEVKIKQETPDTSLPKEEISASLLAHHDDIEELSGPREEVSSTPPLENTSTEAPNTLVQKEFFVPPKTPPVFKEPEPQSLIVHDEEPLQKRVTAREEDIPEDLPLLPFESSPHVWSFARYKNVFHKENGPTKIEPSQKQEENVPPVVPTVASSKETQISTEKVESSDTEEEEISVEKTPLTKGDESMVFLAGAMLLVIILILGYMYSNGRL